MGFFWDFALFPEISGAAVETNSHIEEKDE
jgi:hypothetical protein